jgi:hypothetical protein
LKSATPRIIFRDAGFDFADQVGADISRFGVNASAKLGEQGNKAGAKRKSDDPEWGLGDCRVRTFSEQGNEPKDAADTQKSKGDHQEAGDRATAKRDDQCLAHAFARRRRCADIAPDSDSHADVAGNSREGRAEQECDRCDDAALKLVVIFEERDQDAHDHGHDDRELADGSVLAVQIGFRALKDGP